MGLILIFFRFYSLCLQQSYSQISSNTGINCTSANLSYVLLKIPMRNVEGCSMSKKKKKSPFSFFFLVAFWFIYITAGSIHIWLLDIWQPIPELRKPEGWKHSIISGNNTVTRSLAALECYNLERKALDR